MEHHIHLKEFSLLHLMKDYLHISVGPAGNDVGKVPFEISLVEHDRFADFEIGTAGAECSRYLGFRLAADKSK